MKTTNTNRDDGINKSRKDNDMHVGVLKKLGIRAKRKVNPNSVKVIVSRCQAGDPLAFKQLFDKHIASVNRHLSFLIGPNEDVDDLIQLVFLNVFQSIKRFKGDSAFSTWLFRITINVARQEIRFRTRQRKIDSAIDNVNQVRGTSVTKTPENILSNWQEVYKILDCLSHKKRETLILYMYEGYSLEEIAKLLGSSISTIGSRLQSGRREIVSILANEKRL